MRNFFEHQDRAKKTTHYLIFLFACAIAFTILAAYACCIWVASRQGLVDSFWELDWLLAVSIIIGLIIALGSYSKTAALRQGGQVVALSLGGRLVSQQPQNPEESKLLNVVEEMAIAAGVAVPQVYLIPGASINAFAAGRTPNDAVIGVTQGAIAQLNREQLQGVIGHEFSHIVNGDMALNLKLMGIVHGLLLIHLIGREFLLSSCRGRSSRDNKSAGLLAFSLAVMVIGGIGWVFGQLIKSAVSRQREYLADAAAVQFTRNPQGITDALRIIAQQSASPRMMSASAESASHLFFNNVSLLGSFMSAFATHPPLAHRIRRLGGGSLASAQSIATGGRAADPGLRQATAQSVMPLAASPAANRAPARTIERNKPANVSPDEAVAQIGKVTPGHLAESRSILKGIPEPLMAATRSRIGSTSIIYSLLLSSDDLVRSHQKSIIAQSATPAVIAQVESLAPLLSEVKVRSRLPLLELCIPSLKTLPPTTAAQLFAQVKALIKADGKLSLSEFALQSLLQYRLAPHFRPEPAATTHSQLNDLWPDCWTLLSAIAQSGHSDPANADYAFRDGLSHLPGIRHQTIPKMPNSSLHDVSRALTRLRATAPKLKQAIADACAHTVLADGRTTDQEAELLRAILIALGCPIPPFLTAA